LVCFLHRYNIIDRTIRKLFLVNTHRYRYLLEESTQLKNLRDCNMKLYIAVTTVCIFVLASTSAWALIDPVMPETATAAFFGLGLLVVAGLDKKK